MPNIDQLSIEITADADKATKAIANLTAHLTGLSTALNRINSNSISKFAKSVESLSKSGKMVDDTSRALDKMAKNIASNFGIKSKDGLAAIRDGLNEIAEAHKQFAKSPSDSLYANVEKAKDSLAGVIKQYDNLKTKTVNSAEAVKEFVAIHNQSGRKVSLSNVAAELGDDLSRVRKVLGSGFTAALSSTGKGVKDLEEFLADLDQECGTNFSTKKLDEAIRDLEKTLTSARTAGDKLEDSLYYQQQLEHAAQVEAYKYGDAIERFIDLDISQNTNNLDNLVNTLKKLSDVTLPDFSPFADAINALNRASTDKIVKNIQAVKQALNDTVPSSENLKESLNEMGSGAVTNIANEFQGRMLPAIRDIDILIDKMFNSFVNSVSSVSGFSSIIADLADRFNDTALAISGCVDKAYEFINIVGFIKGLTSVPLLEDFRAYKPDIVDVTANIRDMGDAIKSSSESADDAEESISRAGNTGATAFGRAKSETISFKEVMAKSAEIIEHVGHKLGELGELGMKGLEIAYKPLEHLADEYKEKLEKIANHFKKFRMSVQKQLTKMQAFWNRIVKTFTFMLVRKAITAMIKDVKEAVDELVLFEKNLGTLSNGQFNKSLSEIQADFHYIGRAIVAAFEPLINYVVPALNAVASALANVLALVGEFFAAFTGQNYFVTARRTVVDYGDSLEDNNKKLKEQKKLLLGIDELNVLPSNNDSSSDKNSGVNYKDAFDEKPVSDKMKNLAAKVKDILSKIFDPLKKAWDRNGEYVKKAFKHMMSEIGKLCASVGRDFLEVWNGPIMAKVFDHILQSVGDIMYGIGNLAKNFRKAWDEGGKGKKIFENIAQILETLTGWVEKTTKYFKDWTEGINFNPLLSALEELTKKLNKVANFLGGVFYDVMTNVVFKYIEFMIEEGLPHLMHAIDEVINHFDFDKIRTDLQVLEIAFEHMAEEIDIGVTNAIKNVGIALGDWMSSDEFTKFCDSLAYFMSLVTAERVEKLFTALGTALVDIAEALAKFVSSDAFKAFIDKLVEWYDSKSAEDIAGYIKAIAGAIIGFKFVAFVGPGIAGFLKFIATIATLKNIGTIASNLTNLGTAASTAGAGMAAGGATAATGLGTIAVASAGLTAEAIIIGGELAKLGEAWGTYHEAAKTHKKEIEGSLGDLEKLYKEKGPEIAAEWAKTVYDVDISGDDLYTAQLKVEQKINDLWDDAPQDMFDGFMQGLKSYFGKDGEGIGKYFEDVFTNVVDGVEKLLGIASPSTVFSDIGENTALGFKNGYDSEWSTFATDALALVGTFISNFQGKFADIGSGIAEKFNTVKEGITTKLGEAKDSAVTKAGEIKDNVQQSFETLKTNSKEKFDSFKNNVKTNFDEACKNASKKAEEITKKVSEGIKDIPKNVKDKFNNVRDNIKDKMEESITKISDKLTKMKQKFEKFNLESVAKNIIRGFTSGLKSAWTDVVKWANDAVAALKKKFQEALKIKSPSKVFEEYGKYTVMGFNEGISSFQDTTGKTVDKWVASFSDMTVSLMPENTMTGKPFTGVVDTGVSYETGLTKSDLVDVLNDFANRLKSGGETRIILEMDGRKIYEQMVHENKAQIMRTGRSSFVY